MSWFECYYQKNCCYRYGQAKLDIRNQDTIVIKTDNLTGYKCKWDLCYVLWSSEMLFKNVSLSTKPLLKCAKFYCFNSRNLQHAWVFYPLFFYNKKIRFCKIIYFKVQNFGRGRRHRRLFHGCKICWQTSYNNCGTKWCKFCFHFLFNYLFQFSKLTLK